MNRGSSASQLILSRLCRCDDATYPAKNAHVKPRVDKCKPLLINVQAGPTAVLGWYPGGSQAGSPYAPGPAADICTDPV